jgi:exodeoxyribonuclease-5
VKFAYALTCHKSQGGQWEAVFVDQGYLTEENVNTDFLRWLYTAMTRATQELFLMNFNPQFFAPAVEGVNERKRVRKRNRQGVGEFTGGRNFGKKNG